MVEKEISESEKGCIFILIAVRLREPDPEKIPSRESDPKRIKEFTRTRTSFK
jgi:hypothetical protein